MLMTKETNLFFFVVVICCLPYDPPSTSKEFVDLWKSNCIIHAFSCSSVVFSWVPLKSLKSTHVARRRTCHEQLLHPLLSSRRKVKKKTGRLTILQFLYRRGFLLPCRMLSKPLLGQVEGCLLIGSLKTT